MKHHTKRNGKRMSSRRHRCGRKMMKGGYVNPNSQFNASTYVPTPNGIGASENGVNVNGTFANQMNHSDSHAMAMSNAIDKISPAIMASSQSGANSIQNGGRRQNNRQNQNQYQNQFQQQNNRQNQNQNQQQNQRGGVWNQMIGEAVAPLVLLGLQQYYGPRSKSNRGNRGNRSTKSKRTRRYRK